MTVPKIATLKGMNLTELKRMAREKQLGTTDSMRGFTKDQVIDLILEPTTTDDEVAELLAEVDDEEDDIEEELDEDIETDDEVEDEDLELPEDEDEEEDPIQEGLATDPAPDADDNKYQLGSKKRLTPQLASDDDEADDEADEEPAEKTFTAKQVATRIGTDAKTLRKFFRSPASTIEPCGQGGRYEFDAKDMPAIKKEFDAWNSTKGTRAPAKPKGEGTPRTSTRSAPAHAEVIEEDDEVLDLDDDEEPSDDELLELDDEVEDDEVEDDEVDDEEED